MTKRLINWAESDGDISMPRVSKENLGAQRRRPPAMTPEEEENQMISLAISLAKKKLMDGTASNQVITHYLKLGSTREQLEKEKLRKENDLLVAKVEALESQKRDEELYQKVIDALRIYNGSDTEYDPDELE